jgi:hypothetical protein
VRAGRLTRATAIGASAGQSADISGSIVVLFSGITINALMIFITRPYCNGVVETGSGGSPALAAASCIMATSLA